MLAICTAAVRHDSTGLRNPQAANRRGVFVNASVLKIKLAMAIIGISSIALLRTFIEAGNLGSNRASFTESGVMWQVLIHITFVVSAIGIVFVDRVSDATTRSPAE